MTLSERDRHQMLESFKNAFGEEVAMTLAEHLPPVGWADVATKQDLLLLEARMDLRFEAVDRRFDAVDRRFDAIDRRFQANDDRFEGIERRFDELEERMDLKLENLENRLMTVMADKLSEQFRGLVIAFVTVMIAFGGLVLTAVAIARP